MSQTPRPPYSGDSSPQTDAQPVRRRRVDRLRAEEAAEPSHPAETAPVNENPYPHLQGYTQESKPQPPVSHKHHAQRRAMPEERVSLPQQGYVPASQPAKPVRKPALPKVSRTLLMRLLLAVCLCVFLVSAFLLIRYFSNIAISRKASEQLEAAYSAAIQNTEMPVSTLEPTASPTPTAAPITTEAAVQAAAQPTATAVSLTSSASELWPSKYPLNPTLRISTVFYEMQRQNKDIIGWLKIDGVVEEAVLQRDNEYYLTHNSLGQRSVTGALFLDEACDLKTVPTQMVIHGHNMKEGAMFGSLKKYKVKDASFYRAHPYIDFNTIYENGRYVIFAASEVDIRWDRADYLPFWQDVRFSSAEAFTSYVEKARSLSHYRCNVDVQPGDRLLTLSTCEGSDDNKRLIVMARKLRDGENELELNMSIMSTSDR